MRKVVYFPLVLNQNRDESFCDRSEFCFTQFANMIHQFLPPVHVHIPHVNHNRGLVGRILLVAFILYAAFDIVDISGEMCNLLGGIINIGRQNALLVLQHLDTRPQMVDFLERFLVDEVLVVFQVVDVEVDLFEVADFAVDGLLVDDLLGVGVVGFNIVFGEGFDDLHYFLTVEVALGDQAVGFARVLENVFEGGNQVLFRVQE